jgi:hypothetical protein
MAIDAVPVTVSGVNWNTALLGLLNVLIGSVFVALIKNAPKLKEIAQRREANLLDERAEEMGLMRERIRVLEAERARDRHRINNLSQCLDALLMLIEQDPGKASQAAALVRKMRLDQQERENAEAAAIAAASIKGSGE